MTVCCILYYWCSDIQSEEQLIDLNIERLLGNIIDMYMYIGRWTTINDQNFFFKEVYPTNNTGQFLFLSIEYHKCVIFP